MRSLGGVANHKTKRKVAGSAVFKMSSRRRNVCGPSGPRVSDRQRELLLAFMEEHPQLATPSYPLDPSFTRVVRDDLWKQLKTLLNEAGPAERSVDQWQAFWRKERFNAEQELIRLREQQR